MTGLNGLRSVDNEIMTNEVRLVAELNTWYSDIVIAGKHVSSSGES